MGDSALLNNCSSAASTLKLEAVLCPAHHHSAELDQGTVLNHSFKVGKALMQHLHVATAANKRG
jgi:hypothetical protein